MLQKPASAVQFEKDHGFDGPNVRHFKNLEEVKKAIMDNTLTWEECVAANAELGIRFVFEGGKITDAHFSEPAYEGGERQAV